MKWWACCLQEFWAKNKTKLLTVIYYWSGFKRAVDRGWWRNGVVQHTCGRIDVLSCEQISAQCKKRQSKTDFLQNLRRAIATTSHHYWCSAARGPRCADDGGAAFAPPAPRAGQSHSTNKRSRRAGPKQEEAMATRCLVPSAPA